MDARIIKPMTNEQGISDPVNVFLPDGRVCVAWWDSRDGYWHDIEGETFNAVKYWNYIDFPSGWDYDSDLYGGAE